MDGTYGNIVSFVLDAESVRELVLFQIVETRSMFGNDHGELRTIVKINCEVTALPISEIDKVCVCVDVKTDKYICPVPNLFSF